MGKSMLKAVTYENYDYKKTLREYYKKYREKKEEVDSNNSTVKLWRGRTLATDSD